MLPDRVYGTGTCPYFSYLWKTDEGYGCNAIFSLVQRILIISLIHLLSNIAVFGQHYRKEIYTIENGLMHNNVKGVFQDANGVIYAANGTGFSKLLGDRIENIPGPCTFWQYDRLDNLIIPNGSSVLCWAQYRLKNDRIIENHLSSYENARISVNPISGDTINISLSNWEIMDQEGYTWSYMWNDAKVLRIKEADTIDVTTTLDSLGIVFSNLYLATPSYKNWRAPNFLADNRDGVWFKSRDHRIHKYDLNNAQISSITDSIANLNQILYDEEGQLWITQLPGIEDNPGILSMNSGTLVRYNAEGAASLFLSEHGNLWMKDDLGLHNYKHGNFQLRHSIYGTRVSMFRSTSFELFVISFSESHSTVYGIGKTEAEVLYETSDEVYQVFEDEENNIWLSTNGGLIKLTQSPISFHTYPREILDLNESLNHLEQIRYSFTNKYGTRFYSSRKDGFYAEKDGHLKKLLNAYINAYAPPVESDGSIYVACNALTEDQISHEFENIYKIDTALNVRILTSGDLLKFQGENLGLYRLRVFKNQLYLSTSKGVFAEVDSQFKLFPPDYSEYAKRRNDTIPITFSCSPMGGNGRYQPFRITEDLPRLVSVRRMVKSMKDLVLFNLESRQYLSMIDDSNMVKSVSHLWEYQRNGWITLGYDKLALYNGDSISYFDVPKSKLGGSRLTRNWQEPIFLSNGKIIYESIDHGLIKFNPNDGSFFQYTTQEGLRSNRIRNLFLDSDSSHLWISTPFALQRFEISEFEGEVLTGQSWDESDGLIPGYPSEMVGDSLIRVYTENGYSEIDLSMLDDTIPPKIHIRDVRMFYETFDWSTVECTLDSAYGKQIPSNMQLAYNQNHLTFDFQGVSHSGGALTFEYQMVGQDEKFYSSEQKSVSYTNLDPGEYEFIVRSIDEAGNRSKDATITFVVAKPFWETAWFIILASLSLLLSLYVLYRWRVRALKERQVELETEVKNATKEIREKKEQVEKKNEEIMASITYAKKLQTAVLPPARVVKEYFKDSFLLYLPRDIVSGDFYWMESNNDVSYFAVADCTGHGVPGAMLSVIGMNGLNRALNEQHLTQPKDILTSLSEHIQRHFEQSEATVRDGMDICLCTLDNKTMKLTYAGANNPVWIARKGEMHILKADRRAIGHDDQNRAFTQQEFQLQKGDTVYLASDGYQDQIGGEKNRKLMTKVFRERLVQLSALPMDEQRQTLLTEHEAWKGSGHQTDDICVMGIRV